MGLGEVGMFLPAESAYGTPGAYSQSLRAEATKRAAYLSEMDQFYAELEESQRQFDESLALKAKTSIAEFLLGAYQAKTARKATRSQGEGLYLGRDEKLDLLREMQLDKTREESPIQFFGSSP